MNQSSALFLAFALAFIIYITAKGELKNYIGFLTGTQQTAIGSLPTQLDGAKVIVGASSIEQGAEDLLANNPLNQINASAFGNY